MMRIDLHTHSSTSDGTDSPAELMAKAAESGLDVVALTDHDTTAGWADAAAAARRIGISLVRGAEMSTLGRGEDGGTVSVHLLAYLFNPEDAAFVSEQVRLRRERKTRLRRMAQDMADDGLPIDPDELLAGIDESAGRPHIAKALVRVGAVDSVQEAFDRYLADGQKYYRGRADTDINTAVQMVQQAGGVSVIAHLRAHKRGRLLSLEHVEELIELGLGGLEIAHPDHDDEARRLLTRIADRHGLIKTGSSDYHGANKPTLIGAQTTEVDQFDELTRRATGIAVQH